MSSDAAAAGSSELSESLRDSETDEVDPFTYYVPLRWWDYILIAINTLWLLPLRLIFIVIPCVVMATLIAMISVACERFDPENPTPLMGWRRRLVKLLPPFARLTLFGLGFNWITTRGRLASNMEAPVVAVAPHSSMLDIVVMAAYHNLIPAYLARIETTRTPIYGRLTRRTIRCIFVDRDDPDSRMKAVREIQRRAEMEGIWPKLLVFPEGTTTNRKQLIQFKRGAFLPQLPVQPVIVKYKGRLNGMVWGGHGTSLIQGLYITICQLHNSCEVEFLPVYEPSQAEKENASLFATNVQLKMAEALGLKASSQSVEDLLLMRMAREQGLPYSSAMVVYPKAHRRLGMAFDDMKKWLQRFGVMDRDKDGFVTAEDLAAYLHVPNDACLQAIFSASTPVEDKLSFKKYLYGLVGQGLNLLENEQFLKAMFAFFDKDGDGVVHDSDISSQLPVHKLPSPVATTDSRKKRHRKQEPSSEEGEAIPTDMDLEQFKSLLARHPEYPLLFHECQNAGVSSPPPVPQNSAPLTQGGNEASLSSSPSEPERERGSPQSFQAEEEEVTEVVTQAVESNGQMAGGATLQVIVDIEA